MNAAAAKADVLKKITLSLQAGDAPDSMNLIEKPHRFEFIFGIGGQGITPFEYELANRIVGEEVIYQIKREQMSAMFQHLHIPALNFPIHPGTFYLRAKIAQIQEAEPREVIRAMAVSANCGDGCCGDH